jgi:hypothetical protein
MVALGFFVLKEIKRNDAVVHFEGSAGGGPFDAAAAAAVVVALLLLCAFAAAAASYVKPSIEERNRNRSTANKHSGHQQ